jgi:outer membrane protein
MTCGALASSQERALSLREAQQVAATQNYQILIQRQQREEAALGARAARLPYTPVLSLRAEGREGALVTNVGGAAQRRRSVNYGGALGWSAPTGTALELSLGASEQLAGAFGPPYASSLGLSVTQPLLRGAWEVGAYTPALEADVDAELQRALLRSSLNELLLQVEVAYWELAFAQADLAIKTRSRARAQQQYEDTRENIRRGILAEPEIYVVEENVVFFEGQLNQAGESLVLARSRLARLLQLPLGAPLVASDDLEGALGPLPVEEEARAEALSLNPELVARRLEARRARLRLAFEERQAWPSLDVSATLALNGLDEDRAGSWAQVGGAAQPELRLGVVFSVPLGEEARRGRAEAAEAASARRVLALKDTEQRLEYAVRDLLTSLRAQEERLALTRRRVELARLKLEAEVERYKSGISNLDAVSRFQRDLDTALIGERRARVELLVARSRLLVAQGTLHERRGVEVR